MTRFKTLFAVLFLAAIVALVAGPPVAQAQVSCGTGCSIHFVGAGSSAQFQMAAIAADQAAITANGGSHIGVKHWTKKFKASTGDGAYLNDNRNGLIVNQTGNIWLVWLEVTPGTVTDVWADISVDSTVGVRCALAYETNGLGCQMQITSSSSATPDNIVKAALYPDNAVDVNLDLAAWNTINTAISGGAHVNVGLTDIRPEDAAYATKRLISTTRNSTLTELGDQTAANIGGNIVSNQGTSAFAQPVGFSLPGEHDPFNTHLTVPTTFVTYPIGAAPVVFIANNGGTPFTGSALNLVSGVTPDAHATGQVYPLATLFDGSTSCDTNNVALGGSGTAGGTALTLFLREPLSGTMNTTEFSLFRSFDNASDSQEGNAAFNGGVPMNFTGGNTGTGTGCTGNGLRSRAIGTGEVVGATSGGTGNAAYGLLGTSNSLGYIFTGWGNLAKFGGTAGFQYLTVDGVDPLFAAPTAYSVCVGGPSAGQVCGTAESCGSGTCTAGGSTAQTVPFCGATNCTSDLWNAYTDSWTGYTAGAGVSYPNIRNGMYKAWSIYRWIAIPNTDPYGPALVSQEAQNYVDSDVADFVPFAACAPGTGTACLSGTPTDGLSVFRSHFSPTSVTYTCNTATKPSNGAPNTNQNSTDNGNTLGGGSECGGDVGGLIYGPFGTTSPSVSYVTWASAHTANKGYKITYKNGDLLTAGGLAVGNNVSLNCTNNAGVETITNTTVGFNGGTATTVYLSTGNPGTITIACKLTDGNITHGAAAAATHGTGQDATAFHSKHE
jgi:hypothetical protein